MNDLIECHALSKHYGGVKALDRFDLELELRGPVGLVGANGAGKSTLFSILCGFTRPSSGTASLLGLAAGASGQKGKISILPQDTAMFKNISVQEQLCHYARLHGFSRIAAREETDRVLNLVKATVLARQYPETLSFGQRKKIMLAQSLLGNPGLILLDEPTSGLDPVATSEVHQLLGQLGQEYHLFISSHNLHEIEGICRDIVVINRGKLVKTGTIDEIKRVGQCFRIRLENQPQTDIKALLQQIPGIANIEPDAHDARRWQIHYDHDRAHDVQIAIMSEFNRQHIEIAEISKGTALADEISSLLKE